MTTIRTSTVEDADDCLRIYTPYVRDSAISFEESPPTESEFQERIKDKIESYPWLVCEHENEVIGFAYASQLRSRDAYQWSVESSVYVDEQSQRAGVAKGLYNSLFETLRLQGFYNVYAGTALPNPPSVEFHQAMGFEPIGVYRNIGYKQGEWHDVKWWHLTLQPPVSDPVRPTSVDELVDTPELNNAVTTGISDIGI